VAPVVVMSAAAELKSGARLDTAAADPPQRAG
jgi:hypothetical protein